VGTRSPFISSVRLGHASNSSSTHSIILDSSVKADNLEGTDGLDDDARHFGWSGFILKTPEAKARYAAAQIRVGLRQAGFTDTVSDVVVRALTGVETADDVDHQSVMGFPGYHPGLVISGGNIRSAGTIHKPTFHDQFAKAFAQWLINDPSVTVLGGNDNAPEDTPNIGGTEYGPFESLRDRGGPMLARIDGAYWTLFNPRTGAKIRMSFTKREPMEKAATPELCDIKITDFCPFGCAFCYQNSTIKGQHASLEYLSDVAATLGSLGVFEAALGGGETTMHPDFPEILQGFFDRGVLPNFTTFSTKWLDKPHITDAVSKYCGAVAFSINDSNDENMYVISSLHLGECRVGVQLVLGVTTDRTIMSVMDAASESRIPVTLLGFKSFGRATASQKVFKNDMDAVLSHAAKLSVRVGMDTAAVNEYAGVLDGRGVHRSLLADKEGLFSMYIDAVGGFIAKDSYTHHKTGFEGFRGGKSLFETILKKFPFSGVSPRMELSVIEDSPAI